LSQCAIPPGETFLYEFTVAEQRGTFWYHAHVSTQLADGLFGPLVSSTDCGLPSAMSDNITDHSRSLRAGAQGRG
jgi:hypothetical protein